MNKWQAALIGAVILVAYTWWIYKLGADSVEIKVITVTMNEEKRQAEGVGELKLSEVKHGQKVETVKRETATVAAPQNCDRVDIGDLRVERLGGVRR